MRRLPAAAAPGACMSSMATHSLMAELAECGDGEARLRSLARIVSRHRLHIDGAAAAHIMSIWCAAARDASPEASAAAREVRAALLSALLRPGAGSTSSSTSSGASLIATTSSASSTATPAWTVQHMTRVLEYVV
ncbi:hypothetical protein EON68_01570 [archaeon]|nr:MAG: hypothetical protein EON68_01570 [archaeon]